MSNLPIFTRNDSTTVGIELELQLINLHNFNLSMEAQDFLRRAAIDNLKPEMTQSMIEINSSPHLTYPSLLAELNAIKTHLSEEAKQTHLGICGGGIHPFQKWKEQRVFPNERFNSLSAEYGYLAKQCTVFGQHIHVGCQNGDDALYLCHALIPYIPHFIALAASSPFQQGIDTAFNSSRLMVISFFPLSTSGTPPWIFTWQEFEKYFQKLAQYEIAETMKDLHWDIRPKPEYGTVELRIADTPLTVDKAAEIAAYFQLISHWLLEERLALSQEVHLTYEVNRFKAARYGFEAVMIDPLLDMQVPLADIILRTCDQVEKYASKFQSKEALEKIREAVISRYNGSVWLRERYAETKYFSDVVRAQTELWMA